MCEKDINLLPQSYSAIFSLVKNSSSSAQHHATNGLALEPISYTPPRILPFPLDSIRSPVDPIPESAIGDHVLAQEQTSRGDQWFLPRTALSQEIIITRYKGPGGQLVMCSQLCWFGISMGVGHPDDILPDHPVADCGPYLSPGPRVQDGGPIGLVIFMGMVSDDERGGGNRGFRE
ncbi:hypothetical protein BDM02DRAFT_3132879 [Thelephora ganbajun]|uniref:Uncharacterized protein n=1 Tax=Thelephora ganbajun TaxID=370292 RepID=A0ACB6YZT5_THEGA|nr:hypothetical protein BDM02DRAFT_3132879 [Thelephora ganbajun]